MSSIWSVGMTLKEAERNIIVEALKSYYYNKSMTARALGISVRGLDGKMKDQKIEYRKNYLKYNGEEVAGNDNKEN